MSREQRLNAYSSVWTIVLYWVNLKEILVLRTLRKVSKYRVFSGPYSVQMRENTDQKKHCIWTLFTQWSCLKAEDLKKIIPFGFSKFTVIWEISVFIRLTSIFWKYLVLGYRSHILYRQFLILSAKVIFL